VEKRGASLLGRHVIASIRATSSRHVRRVFFLLVTFLSFVAGKRLCVKSQEFK